MICSQESCLSNGVENSTALWYALLIAVFRHARADGEFRPATRPISGELKGWSALGEP
jgi:hypothetical protein